MNSLAIEIVIVVVVCLPLSLLFVKGIEKGSVLAYNNLPSVKRERKRVAYLAELEKTQCKGITLKGQRCSIHYCSISHKSYLDK